MPESLGKIGPYELLRRLGAGGMGEVFLAYDERLDRQVAIKRIRSDKSASSERRERFRREARVAARLNHPAIVQVYDVLAEGDVDSIVMEAVEGTDLRTLIGGRPLPLETAVVIARDVADGLAEAHRQGIVHRDLKSENVLVTPAGRAKITDFGIAKRLLAGKTEDSLTAIGHVMGTYRAMSPEQARGEEVDHRSDLFSFGILLYEMLTGRSPFAAENELAMLNRIVHDRQTPVREVNPAVPEELSLLVDHLLEKDPLLRPRSAGELGRELAPMATATATATLTGTHAWTPIGTAVEPASRQGSAGPSFDSRITGRRSPMRTAAWIGLALLVALGIPGAWVAFRPAPEPLYVAVLKPEVHGTPGLATDLDLLSSDLRIASVRGLLALEGVSPKSLEETDAVPGLPAAVAKAVSADEVVITKLSCRPVDCQVSLSRIRGRDGTVLWAEHFDIPADDLGVAAGAMGTQIRQAYSDRSPRPGAFVSEASDRELRELLTLRRRFESRQEASLDDILQRLKALRERAPRFLEVYLLEIEVARFQHFFSRQPEVLRRAFAVAREARKMAPEDRRVLRALFYTALEAGDLPRAEEALSQFELVDPGDVAILELRSGLLLARGQTREAIALMRTEVGRQPAFKRLVTLGVTEFQQGEIAAGRQHLEASLRRAPGNADALSALGQLELQSGDPKRALELYRTLVRRSPGFAEISNLGLAELLAGRYAEAAEAFERVAAEKPRNPFVALNLADTYLLLGRKAEAEALYRKVLALIDQDANAGGAQFLTVKAQALAHLGRGLEAVTALREALRLAPESGAPAFEAAVVYALLGEETSAVASAETALRNGCGASWFSLPWFNGLRGDPRFQEVLARYPGKPGASLR
ncbi:MAG TPA: protein kinase [Thermoanaerobaculia bacterium]|jgi:serine/threonine-protein kinase|nr:protein kinase [Thermoanaerobaculia bacterium]